MKFTYPSGSRPLEGYTIKRGVGRGGFGEVYFATSDAGKEVALKLIRRNLEVELRGVTQCLNLKHPNLIDLYDIKTDDMGDQWVIMEYVSGESLEDVIDRNPKGLPVEEALYWMRGLCAGVAYLHDHGIVHRDLKPGNIFSDEGTVKIGDYGLAKFISCSRRSGQTESVGTVHYMAPEIANGRYGREIDTYALGIILFEMLTGHVPFEGESVGEVLMKHLTAEPELSVLQEPYYDIVKRALAKAPELRIKNVGELVAMLPGSQSGSGFARMDSQTIPHAPSPPPAVSSTAQPKEAPRTAGNRTAAPNVVSRARDELHDAGQRLADHFAVEEPIAKAFRTGFATIKRRWSGEHPQPLTLGRKILLGVAIYALVMWMWFNNGDPFDLAIKCLVIYGIYYAVWASLIRPGIRRHTGEAALAAGPAPTAPVPPPPQHFAAQPAVEQTVAWTPDHAPSTSLSRYEEAQRRRRARTNWRDRAAAQLAAKPLREKLTELLGSMLLAALFSAVAACVVPLFSGSQVTSEITATYFWLAIVGTLGSWAVMIPAKLIEGKLEDQMPMRIALMLLGALLGVAAWGFAAGLMTHLPGWSAPIDVERGLVSHEMLGWNPSDRTNPPAAVYIAYFAFIFLIPRWWRQAEFTRSARLSIWRVIGCVLFAWLVHLFWWFPQPLGMAAAGVISMSTQLASPWMTPSQRRAISELPEQAVTS
jgi:serine/threonine protein kinase